MRLFIDHRTHYQFGEPQRRVIQLLRVTPQSFEGQAVIDWHVECDCDARLRRSRDGYGNEVAMLYVDGPVNRISLSVGGEVLTDDRAGVVNGAPDPLPPLLFTRSTPQTQPDEAIAAFAAEVGKLAKDPIERLHKLCDAVHERIRFDTEVRNPHRDAVTTFTEGHGVCQDHAHVFLAAARVLGFPARYVSGHLWRPDAEGAQPAAHGWAEAHVEGLGWVGFDPANGLSPTDAYVRVAVGLDYRDAAPISGARIGGGEETMQVEVAVAQAQSQAQMQSQSFPGRQD
jgi:transglutaminase-like putative cysteine protease